MQNSKISWTHHSAIFWHGCSQIEKDPACHAPCYAKVFDERHKRAFWGDEHPRVSFVDKATADCFRFNKRAAKLGERHRVFVNSFSDFFEDRPELEAWRDNAFDVFTKTPYLDYLLLTKRVDNANRYMREVAYPKYGVLNNVWMGCTASTQELLDKRAPVLASIPAVIRYISIEPMVGAVDVHRAIASGHIHQIICGGASGVNHAKLPFDIESLARIAKACSRVGVALFVKQDSHLYPERQGNIPDEFWKLKQYPRSRGLVGREVTKSGDPLRVL